MFCPNCGTESEKGGFCRNCGTKITAKSVPVQPQPQPKPQPQTAPVQPKPQYQAPPVQTQVYVQAPKEITEDQLPEKYRPLSAWAYFGLQLLFAIPVVGLIFLIVFSCSSGNINRRSFARSYWCSLIIAAVIILIFAICGISLFGIIGSMQ